MPIALRIPMRGYEHDWIATSGLLLHVTNPHAGL